MAYDLQNVGRVVAMGVAAICLAGCTMCPNPFDYAGPVPNGSAPQNDFQARSNGVIPIGATPRPWPPLVKREADGEEPTIAGATPSDEPTPAPRPDGDGSRSVVQVAGELPPEPVAD